MIIAGDAASIARRMDPFLLKHWRFILAAAEEGSFRRAADRLGVQQSTLSRRIRDIEDAMGATLFARTYAGVTPTFAGRRLLGPAREILSQASQAAQAVERAGMAQDGMLRIGLPPTTPGGHLNQLLNRFGQACPSVRIELVDIEPASQAQAVRRDELDVMIRPGTDAMEGCEALRLWDEPILIAMPESDPLVASPRFQIADINGRHFIFRAADPALPLFREILITTPAVSVTIATQPITREPNLLQAVALGQGLTLTTAPGTSLAPVIYRTLTGNWLPISAVWSRSNPNPALTRLLALARDLRGPSDRKLLSPT